MDQHQPAVVPIEARTCPLGESGLGGNELVGRRAVQNPHGTKTRETHQLHDGATPTAKAQLTSAAKMAPLGFAACPSVGAATVITTLSVPNYKSIQKSLRVKVSQI